MTNEDLAHEHYQLAVKYAAAVNDPFDPHSGSQVYGDRALAAAQVHATLALAAVSAPAPLVAAEATA